MRRTRARARDEPLHASEPAARASPSPPRVSAGYVLREQLGSSGKDKTVYAATRGGRRVAAAIFHKGKGKTIGVEAEFQRLAAAAGFAPRVLHVDAKNRLLVSELLPGGTLIDIAQQQGGRLTVRQQARIVEMLRRLGAREEMGGAGLRHGDASNPANYVASADGMLHLIDFSPPHCRPMKGGDAEDANMGSLGLLLWHAERGLVRRGWVSEPPLLLLREYRLFCRRRGATDPMDPAPDELPPPQLVAEDAEAEEQAGSRAPRRGAPRRASARTAAVDADNPSHSDDDEAAVTRRRGGWRTLAHLACGLAVCTTLVLTALVVRGLAATDHTEAGRWSLLRLQ